MSLSADQLVDRSRLKKELKRWRLLALLFLVGVLLLALRGESSLLPSGEPYIARVDVEGFIGDDVKRDELLNELAADADAKAVIMRMDSPGGSALGGEELYRSLKALSETKPVVALMRTSCTSACYMAALGTTHMMARESSITGSVGVLLEMAEISDLMEKLGIEPVTVKSGELKASPSLFEKFSDKEREYIQGVVNDSFEQFLAMVTTRRKLSADTLVLIKDGRIFTGKQAKKLNLIDAIGGEMEAVAWLESQKNIPQGLEVLEVKPAKEMEGFLGELEQSAKHIIFGSRTQNLDGLVSIWQPRLN